MIIPYEGRRLAAERIVGRKENGYSTTGGRLCLRLFKNDFTPTAASVYADFTECTFSGYSRVNLTPSLWTSAIIASDQAITAFTPQYFTHSGGATNNVAYGYYVTTDPSLGDDRVIFCDRFDSPTTFNGIGCTLPVGLQLSSASLGTGLTIPNEGKLRLMDRLTGKIDSRAGMSLRLFTNAVVFAASLVLADFEQADFSGYDDLSIPYSNWDVAVLTATNRGQTSYSALQTITHSGGDVANTLYGYVMHDGTYALWAERFPDAKTISAENPYYYVQPRFEVGG